MRSTIGQFVVSMLLFCAGFSFGQDNPGALPDYGQNIKDSSLIWNQLDIEQDRRVDQLLLRHIKLNKADRKTKGYRIQLYSGSARAKAERVKTTFLSYFPETTADIIYMIPDFKVRAGTFRTRSGALKFQKKLQKYFPNAIIVADKITFPEPGK